MSEHLTKYFNTETEHNKNEFQKQHTSLSEMVQWLKVWEKYNTNNKRENENTTDKNAKRRYK
ncbi:MAG: hypothetical protein CMF41_04165 [Legionellales bacterium]|nr:hypothetical protein [Legionellales bacterium]|tara:strand:- start:2664 stop:2849 length:186 start_codon:yes stop_codon:yes gene_type:complete